MKKQEFLKKWKFGYVDESSFEADLDAVINHHTDLNIKARNRMRKAVEPPPRSIDRERFERIVCAIVTRGKPSDMNAVVLNALSITKFLDEFYKDGGLLMDPVGDIQNHKEGGSNE